MRQTGNEDEMEIRVLSLSTEHEKPCTVIAF